MLKVVRDGTGEQADELGLGLDDLAREGARRMLAAALEAEVGAYIERYRGERDEHGHALVVRTARHGLARLRWAPARSRLRRHESMTSGRMQRDTDSASRA
jgi:hypothetical protein